MRLLFALLVPCALWAQAPPKQTEMVAMRDGVHLATDIYGAAASERRPVLLQRTPYDKRGAATAAARFVAAGYVVVVQDTRGRFASEGTFYPYDNEGQDGYDTLEWITRQPWSDGRIGTWGASYVGAVQYQAAAEGAPGLAAMCPTATWSSFYRNIYTGGVSRLALIGTAAAGLYPPPAGHALPADWYHTLLSLPLADLDFAIGWRIPWLRGILTHPRSDGFWTRLDLTARVDRLAIPAQHVVGYYDFFSRETIANFQRLRRNSPLQQLILGPWDHGSIGKQKLGEVDFGPNAAFDAIGESLAWFDRTLQHKSAAPFPAVRYFSMGENIWRTAAQWPPEDTVRTVFYLHSAGHAHTRRGDGHLDRIPPGAAEKEDRFTADPADPAPAWPPSILQAKFAPFWGPVDQNPIADRADVLVYSTGVLKEPLRIAGPIEAELWVSQDTPDADWVVKVIDLWPNGFAQNLTVGVQRASAQGTVKRDERYRVTIDVGSVAARIAAGHELRVEVAAAYFPLFERNTNTGEGPWSGATRVATQKVYHSSGLPSLVFLPVVR